MLKEVKIYILVKIYDNNNKHLLIDSCNQKRFGIKATGEAERVNKREAPLSEGRGAMKGNYRGSSS